MSSKRYQSSKTSQHHARSEHEPAEEADLLNEPSPEPKPIARQPAYEVDRIGDILRRVREHRGEDLESISEYLRIRPNYLVALENSRYEDLPADAYVIGFLRTYALYLGLDGKGAIDQYRREMAGRRRKPQLNMPQPMAEGRAPTIAVLVGAALAVFLVYIIWYGLSSPDPSTAEKTVTLAQTPTEEVIEEEAENDKDPLTTQTATSDGIALTVPVSAVTTTTPPMAETKAPEATADTAAKQAQPKTENPKEQPQDIKAKDQKTETLNKDKIEVAPITPPTPLTPEPQKPEAQKKEEPATFGEKAKTRISIKAEKESWIMVTDSKGVTVFDKTLKPGETYNVPAGKGLKLTTSNPAGMTFNLDGAALPKMGASGEIARAIPLEPEKLKSRLTDSESSSAE